MTRSMPRLGLATVLAASVLLVAAAPIAAADGDPYLVKNIRAGEAGSFPEELAGVGNRLYFSAVDGSHGRELWRSNGGAANTVMVRDIAPGAADSTPREITQLGDRLFFSAFEPVGGRELWVSNGTQAGTVRFVDIRPGSKGSAPLHLTVVGSRLYFTANDGVHGRELWTSDGTADGTHMVKNMTAGSSSTDPESLTAFGGRLYFAARTGLWKTDGSASGTRRILDRQGRAIYRPRSLVVSGSMLFFVARNTAGDSSLWRTTGTNSSTRSLLDHVVPQNLTAVGGRLFFSLPGAPGELSQLWKSGGTRSGTVFIKDVWTVSEMTAVGGFAFFAATNPDGQEELYVSDGTAENTRWNYSHKTFGDQGVDNMVDFNGVPYYTFHHYLAYLQCGSTCADGYNWQPVVPYEDDGGDTSWSVRELTVVGGILFYSGWDDHAADDHGQELWAYVP